MCKLRRFIAAWSKVWFKLEQWSLARQIAYQFKVTEEQGGRIIFIGSPMHGNLGDHAIALAMRAFFEVHFHGKTVVEIPGKIFKQFIYKFQAMLRPSDCIAVIGGGFLGTLWMSEEEMVRLVVRTFADNKIVIFPQTVFFESSEHGVQEKETTRMLYQSHRDLHLCVRDNSIRFVKKELCGAKFINVLSVPDIVLFLDYSKRKFERAGALLCFRADKEKILLDQDYKIIERKLADRSEYMRRTDTVVSHGVSLKNREIAVEKKIDEFMKARLVITDRLHGMIFAAITGTPCIALNNTSGKVRGVWSLWLQHLPYIKFVENVDEVSLVIDEMLIMSGQIYDDSSFSQCWEEIANAMRFVD